MVDQSQLRLLISPSPAFELIGKVSEESKVIKAYDQSFSMDLLWFEHTAKFSQKIKLKETTALVKGSVEFMVCNDVQCLPPDQVAFEIPVKIPAKIPLQKDTALALKTTDTLVEQVQNQATNIQDTSASKSPVTTISVEKATEPKPLWLTFLAGLLSGFAAILMPCIFRCCL